ncbi:MAG: VWA domain-containing protein [Lachnospiraceae bacterium]|jgi:Ca-activated chloride channel family protein|nr:VWA domain-containing protein [Lachnospiraceae bacterium]
MRRRRKTALAMAAVLLAGFLSGCSGDSIRTDRNAGSLSYEDAETELDSMLKKVRVSQVSDPVLDIYSDEVSEAEALADISTFPIMVAGSGEINLEIAAATEISAEAPDDWINIVAKEFNGAGYTVGDKKVTVSVRKITSGEVVTYMAAGAYQPEIFIPSNDAWGKMLKSSGIGTEKLTDRIAGNTAGILIKKDVYDTFIEKYKEATLANVLDATLAGDLLFAYTNPYTSSTGLNILTAMLKSFDEANPLSDKAQSKLLEYQKSSPPVAYTTAVLRNQAAKGVINAMVMEEQAYINTPELANYVYIPAGIRHDHPVYTFDYCSQEERDAAKLFVDYCLNDDSQKLASEKGFNRHDDYVGEDSGLDGTGYLTAQKVWKQNKNGGKPIIAVFVADVSGSMGGEPLNSLKSSLINASAYIGSEHYIGLVSYSSDVTVNLPIAQFDATQKAYFSGEVKNLAEGGSTATYDAVLVALNMLAEKAEEVPDAKLMLFVLSDGEQNEGYSLTRITPIVAGLQVPIYTIGYNYSDSNGELGTLSDINEAASLNATSDDIANQLRNLFNVTV